MYCENVCFSRAEFQDVFVNHLFGPFYQVLYLYCFVLYRNKLIANSEDILAPWCSGYHSCTTLFDNLKSSFSTDSNPSCAVSEVCNGESLLKRFPLEIRLSTFRWSTIPQKQFIIISLYENQFKQNWPKKFR